MIKLIACDLDRTLIPNGYELDDNGLEIFSRVAKTRNFTLAYVSGRNWELFEEARKEFPLPLPDYFFGDVGTILYKKDGDGMVEDKTWFSYIDKNTPNWNWNAIAKMTTHQEARLQEEWRQNAYKLSYYVDDISMGEQVTDEMRKILAETNINADVIYSIDPLKKVGLIDILPKIATKVTAVEFLRERLTINKDEVIYCGDSGNDILPLTFGYKSVLVANASNEMKDNVRILNNKNGNEQNLYIAEGNEALNGNYAGGVLKGLVHFGALKPNQIEI